MIEKIIRKLKFKITNKWIKLNTKDLAGKTVAITGATGGIGSQL